MAEAGRRQVAPAALVVDVATDHVDLLADAEHGEVAALDEGGSQ
jgi:hypothetical protein